MQISFGDAAGEDLALFIFQETRESISCNNNRFTSLRFSTKTLHRQDYELLLNAGAEEPKAKRNEIKSNKFAEQHREAYL